MVPLPQLPSDLQLLRTGGQEQANSWRCRVSRRVSLRLMRDMADSTNLNYRGHLEAIGECVNALRKRRYELGGVVWQLTVRLDGGWSQSTSW
jgi:hypothetical protein